MKTNTDFFGWELLQHLKVTQKVLACGARYLGSQRNQSAPGLQTVIADQVICFLREGFDPLLGQPVLGEKDVLIIQRIKKHIIYIYIYEVICVFYIGKNNVVGDFLCIYKHTPNLTHGYM